MVMELSSPTKLAKLLSVCGFDSSPPDVLDLVAAADTNNNGVNAERLIIKEFTFYTAPTHYLT